MGPAPFNHTANPIRNAYALILPTLPLSGVEWATSAQAMGLVAQGLGLDTIRGVMPHAFTSIGPAAAADAYTVGLLRGGARVDKRRDSGASRGELLLVAEFDAWLRHLPACWGRNLCTAVPEDIIAFMESHWVLHHGRTYVGQCPTPTASHSGAKGALLDLEHYFNALGRTGDWDTAFLSGNPCRSNFVQTWRKGYKRELWVAGVRPIAATPATGAHIGMLTTAAPHVAAPKVPRRGPAACGAPSPGSVQHAMHLRDDTLLFYLNEAGQRAGEVRLNHRCTIFYFYL